MAGITRKEAEEFVEKTWNEIGRDTVCTKVYGTYNYPQYTQSFISKMQKLVVDGSITQDEILSLQLNQKLSAGGGYKISETFSKDAAFAKIKEECIQFEMGRGR